MKEIFAELKEVRSGRKLFVREWCLGVEADQSNDRENGQDAAADEKESSTPPVEEGVVPVDLQLLCLHGSCATEKQFHPLLEALDDYLLLLSRRQDDDDDGRPSTLKKLRIRCILFDMIGCGQSPVSSEWEAYHGLELQQDLGAIVQQFTQKDLPLYFLSHSYGPNLLIHWLNSETRASAAAAAAILEKEDNVHGFIFLGSSVRVDYSFPYPDGGPLLFRLPVWILELFQSKLTSDFLTRAIDSSNRELHEQCTKANDGNDMFMVKAFYRQTKWATVDELLQAVGSKKIIHFHGVNDGILDIKYGQDMVSKLSHDRTEFIPVQQASHLVMLEKPAEIANKICDFIVSNHYQSNKSLFKQTN